MKGEIMYSGLVANVDGETFMEDLDERIKDGQAHNYEIEVQYKPVSNEKTVYFSALVIGREK